MNAQRLAEDLYQEWRAALARQEILRPPWKELDDSFARAWLAVAQYVIERRDR